MSDSVGREVYNHAKATARILEAELAATRERMAETQAQAAALEKENRWLKAAHLLLANDEAFISATSAGGESSGPFFFTPGVTRGGTPALWLNVGDTFAYACADAEGFEYADAEELWNIARTEGWPGLVRWTKGRRAAKGENAEPISPETRQAIDLLNQRDAAIGRAEAAERELARAKKLGDIVPELQRQAREGMRERCAKWWETQEAGPVYTRAEIAEAIRALSLEDLP